MNELLLVVQEDIRCYRENGVDLNPYSTPTSRWSWRDGFDGKPEMLLHYQTPYKRGQLAAQLIKD